MGMLIGILALFIVEYGIHTLFNIHFCNIVDNHEYDNWKLPFGSQQSLAFTFQQFCGILVCWTGYFMWFAPEIIGMKQEHFVKWRILAMTS